MRAGHESERAEIAFFAWLTFGGMITEVMPVPTNCKARWCVVRRSDAKVRQKRCSLRELCWRRSMVLVSDRRCRKRTGEEFCRYCNTTKKHIQNAKTGIHK